MRVFKTTLVAIFFLADSQSVSANDNSSSPLFSRRRGDFLGLNMPRMGNKWPNRKGSGWLSLQTSAKYTAYPVFGRIQGMVPLQVSFDYSFDNHFTIGGYVGRFEANYLDTYGTEPYKCAILSNSGGLRMSLHFSDLFNNMFGERVNVRKWDLYATGHIGWHTITWNVDQKYRGSRDFSIGTFSSIGIMAGIKWLPTPRFGVFVEGGKGPVSIFGFGLSAKILK